jgi:hypothetical protein
MNGSEFLWRGLQRRRRHTNWMPRLMMAEARMREMIALFSAGRR